MPLITFFPLFLLVLLPFPSPTEGEAFIPSTRHSPCPSPLLPHHCGGRAGRFINFLDLLPSFGCNCVAVVRCAYAVHTGLSLKICNLPMGGVGVCCLQIPEPPAQRPTLFLSATAREARQASSSKEDDSFSAFTLRQADVDERILEGERVYEKFQTLEEQLKEHKLVLKPFTPASSHRHFFTVDESSDEIHRKTLKSIYISQAIVKKFGQAGLRASPNLRQMAQLGVCPVAPNCDFDSPYRTIDGSCNNVNNPLWGRSQTAFQRITPPKYDDNVMFPHTMSVTGVPLPLARFVSQSILSDRDVPDGRFTLSLMQWSQFIDHDLTHAPFPSMDNVNGEEIDCCFDPIHGLAPSDHPSCFPIVVPDTDPFYAPRGQTCLNFVRSLLAPNEACTFDVAEQMNQISQFVDASNVYGSLDEHSVRLRETVGGRMFVTPGNLLPFDPEREIECDARFKGAVCYFAGDSRVNEMPGLTTLHILFHRYHNSLAMGLQDINPQWDDERLFQEARRINVAVMQHIVYNEWLPLIIGPSTAQRFGLTPRQSGFNMGYDPTLNPNIFNEFATGAFRFGHTLVQGIIRLVRENSQLNVLKLRDQFNSPHLFQSVGSIFVDLFTRGLVTENIQTYDSFITEDLTNHLFQNPIQDFGLDLMSLNIQRARDHGISSYNDVREACGLSRATTFSQFNDQIPKKVIARLEKVYAHPDDVDLFIGGITERSAGDGILGFTFRCVVADEFARAKFGDRFFYENANQAGSFTEAQLNSIRGMSWARIACDNTETIDSIQPLAFRAIDNVINAPQSCSSEGIPSLDLSLWRE